MNDEGLLSVKLQTLHVPSLKAKIFIGYEEPSILSGGINRPTPSNGGCRIMPYADDAAAYDECRALTVGMAWKHRAFQTGFTGGKIVVRCNDPQKIDKGGLMREISGMLTALDGQVVTGCDVNSSMDDMKLLSKLTAGPAQHERGFVLAGLFSKCDANASTGFGVAAAVSEVATHINGPSKVTKVLVLGTGKVGSVVCNLLSKDPRFYVLVSDVVPGLARKVCPEAEDVSGEYWPNLNFDILVPCAASHLIGLKEAQQMKCRAICGASNLPIVGEVTREYLLNNGVIFIPESISSAGAIIQDSIEYYSPNEFNTCDPCYVYGFVSSAVAGKAKKFLKYASRIPFADAEAILRASKTVGDDNVQIGYKFPGWISSSTQETDVAIIGAGMAGTACAHALMKEGYSGSVRLLEQGSVANERGSSNGDSRMYREMYSDVFYSKLMTESLREWKELEKDTKIKILSQNGLLFFGSQDVDESAEGSILGSAQVMEELGIPHDFIATTAELRKRAPALCPQPDDIGVYSRTDGSINATAACRAFSKYASTHGVSVSEQTPVLKVWSNVDGSGDTMLFLRGNTLLRVKEHLVLALGAWSPSFLRDNFNCSIDSQVQVVAWGHYELPDHLDDMPQWFCFRSETHHGLPMSEDQHGLYYGFPSVPAHGTCSTKRMVKVGIDFTPDCAFTGPTLSNQYDASVHNLIACDIDSFVKQHWPDLGHRVDLQYSPYHVTPSQDFVLGQLPGFSRVSLFSGGSGRAFKFGPLLGSFLADRVLQRESRLDISRFDPRRVISNLTMQPTIGPRESEDQTDKSAFDSANGSLGKSHVPFGEQGSGVYSLSTQGCFDVIQKSASSVLSAVEGALNARQSEISSNHVITVCDFGAADGGTSLPLWDAVIERCLHILPSHEVDMKYEDQPNADYQSLFSYTQGRLRIPGRTEKTYLEKHPGKVFVSAVGTGFHSQCLPTNSLDFGYSSTAMHWLSKKPTLSLPAEVVHHTLLKGNRAVSEAWEKQAASDWELILLARAKELRVGGRLYVVNFCVDDEGQHLGTTKGVKYSMFEEMNKQWASIMQAGRITPEEYGRAEIMNYYRTVEEMSRPFKDKSSAVYKAGLRLEGVFTKVTACPYRQKWLSDGGDVTKHGKDLVLTMRTWSNSSFETALDSARPKEVRMAIIDEFYGKIAAEISKKPNEYGMEYVHAFVDIRRVQV